MRIVSILENKKVEKRVAITPEIAKKYIELGFDVSLSENYAEHLGIKDSEYKKNGLDSFEWNSDAYYGRIKGMWTHTNTKKGKSDMSPQPKLIEMLLSL